MEFTYHWLPFSRSYGDILPSSFSANHSSTLGFSPRLRVSVYGTVAMQTPLRGFSRQHDYGSFAGTEVPFGIGSRLKERICLLLNAYHLTSEIHHPTILSLLRPPSGSNAYIAVQEY